MNPDFQRLSAFDPIHTMLNALDDAERRRFRIEAWQLNRAAVDALAGHPIVQNESTSLPLLEREFLGIPLELVGNPASEQPFLVPRFEMYGRSFLIHDYDGAIRHGNDQVRGLAVGRQVLNDLYPSNDPSNNR